MDGQEIRKDANRHMWLCADIVIGLYIVARIIIRFFFASYSACTVLPMTVAAVFFIVESIAVIQIWRWVATKHSDSLATFHTFCSGFRILLVLALLFVEYLCVGRDGIAPYFVSVFICYFALLPVNTVFFAQEAKKLL